VAASLVAHGALLRSDLVDARGDPAEGSERGDAVERLARALAVHRLEVVEAPRPVEAEVLGEPHARDDLVPRHPLLRDVDPEAHAAHPILVTWCMAATVPVRV